MKKHFKLLIPVIALVLIVVTYYNITKDKTVTTYQGHTVKELIANMEASDENYDLQLASIKVDYLELKDALGSTITMPIEDEFYFSFAPYVERSHECFYHSLLTCQGEMVNQVIDVTIIDELGNILFDETVKTNPNGFYGVWLPKDINATLNVTYKDKSLSAPISTTDEAPTCFTTGKLV